MSLEIRYAARSDVGLLREINEDAAYAGPRLLAVADGMGGHAAGEVASAVAISSLAHLDTEARTEDPSELLRAAVVEANYQLRAMVAADSDLEGMGTTVTALLVDRTQFALVHIGDSRAYRLRGGVLVQVTTDHTLVQRLVDEGRITAEEAGVHPQRSLVTRALDGRDGLELDLSMHELVRGDRYLLCSDGLSGVVSDATITEALGLPDVRQAVDRLVELALRGGAPDNVTCVVADIVEADETTAVRVDADATLRVVAGAAAEGPQAVPATAGMRNGTTSGLGDHAAGKAAGLRRPGVTQRGQVVRRRQGGVIGALLAILLVLAGIAGWRYVQSQYFVGPAGTDAAIFRGIDGGFAGVEFSRVTDEARVPLASLGQFQQIQVEAGIAAASLDDARSIVARLVSDAVDAAVLPEPTSEPSPSGSLANPAPTPTGTEPAPAVTTAPDATPSPSTP